MYICEIHKIFFYENPNLIDHELYV